MISVLLPAGSPETCHPITSTRSLESFPVANIPLRDFLARRLETKGLEIGQTPHPGSLSLYLAADTWLSDRAIRQLSRTRSPSVIKDANGHFLAWVGKSTSPPEDAISLELDCNSFQILFPWDLLKVNEMAIEQTLENSLLEKTSPSIGIDGRLRVGHGTQLLPGVYVEGDVIIGEDCTIGPNCYIRGRTSIGDGCKIGQAVEIKNSVILGGTTIGHLSYCGDSIVCENVNFGAGTITANFRHDGQNHQSMVQGRLTDTGRRKFGTVVGDAVHTGIHTSIYPGRKLWPAASTKPGEVVRYDVQTTGGDSSRHP